MAANDNNMSAPAFGTAEFGHFDGSQGLNKREYAAIALRVPGSGHDWLDEIIAEARISDMSAVLLAGRLGDLIGLESAPGSHDHQNAMSIIKRAAETAARLCLVSNEMVKGSGNRNNGSDNNG